MFSKALAVPKLFRDLKNARAPSPVL